MSTIRVNNMTNIGGDGPTYAKGMVIQTVSTLYKTLFDTTAFGHVNVPSLAATITPSSTGSKVLVRVSLQITASGFSYAPYIGARVTGGNSSTSWASDVFGAGASNIFLADLSNSVNGNAAATFEFLDSPSTTSATTYQVQIGRMYSPHVGTVRLNNNSGTSSSITVQEIAG